MRLAFVIFIVFEWLLRLIMLFVVPRNRRPSAAAVWLLMIMIEPVVGSTLFAILGTPKLPKRRRELQRTVDGFTAGELNKLRKVNEPLFVDLKNVDYVTVGRLATVLGGLPPMSGNEVSFITDYQAAFSELVSAIDNAQEYVHLEFFIIVLDTDTEEVFVAMERAVSRGVVVRVLFDAFMYRHYPDFRKMKKRLTRAGVLWHTMLPISLIPGRNFTRPDLRNHRKIVVIDGHTGFTGSQNLVTRGYHRKDGIYYDELNIKVVGPVVWQFNNVFRADWFAETGEDLKELVDKADMPKPAGQVNAQVLPSGPSHENDNNLKLYTSMIHAAKEQVFIVVPYFIPDESLMTAITSAAQRGVKVTMINSKSIDKLFVGHAQRSFYEELLSAGVEIYLYQKPAFLHTKQVTIDDDVAILGSSNLDIRSFELSHEVGLILYDETSVKLLKVIEKQYLAKSNQVHARAWANRPLKMKLLDNISRLGASLL